MNPALSRVKNSLFITAGGGGGGHVFIGMNGTDSYNSIAHDGVGGVTTGNPQLTKIFYGGAGGGAGGSIYILGDEVNIIGDITSLGRIGFTPPNSYGGKGGNGSLGRIRIKAEYIDGFTFPQYYSD